MVTWSTSSDTDPNCEATLQCGFGINEMQDYERKTYKRHKKAGRSGTNRKIQPGRSIKAE